MIYHETDLPLWQIAEAQEQCSGCGKWLINSICNWSNCEYSPKYKLKKKGDANKKN